METFAVKFQSELLFEDAGIYDLLGNPAAMKEDAGIYDLLGNPAAMKEETLPKFSWRVAVLFRGTPFRNGKKGDYGSTTHSARMKTQQEAAASHANFLLLPLRSFGFSIDLFLQANGEQEDVIIALKELYAGLNVSNIFARLKPPSLSQGHQAKDAIDLVLSTLQQNGHAGSDIPDIYPYDFLVILRYDVVFMRNIFPSRYDAKHMTEKIMYLHSCETHSGLNVGAAKAWCTHDAFQLVPRALFGYFMKVFGQPGCFESVDVANQTWLVRTQSMRDERVDGYSADARSRGPIPIGAGMKASGHLCMHLLRRAGVPQGIIFAGGWPAKCAGPFCPSDIYHFAGRGCNPQKLARGCGGTNVSANFSIGLYGWS